MGDHIYLPWPDEEVCGVSSVAGASVAYREGRILRGHQHRHDVGEVDPEVQEKACTP